MGIKDYVVYRDSDVEDRKFRYAIRRDWIGEQLEADELTEDQVEILSWKHLTAEEIATVIGNELEDENYHSLSGIADSFLAELVALNYKEKAKRKLLIALWNSLNF